MATEEKIVIRTINRPNKEDIDDLTSWFCRVFDLGVKDDALEPEMFKYIVSGSLTGNGVTSKKLNETLEVPRSTVIYHLNRFIYSGLVIRKGTRYYLRSEDMASTIEELQADMEREFLRLISIAEKMDELFTNNSYGGKKGSRTGRGRSKVIARQERART